MAHTNPSVRHDIVLLFDIVDGNPNGDPDMGNRPRTDDETGHGIVTNGSIKRKIRDTVDLFAGSQPRNGIFVKAGTALQTTLNRSYTETGTKLDEKTRDADDARRWLCDNYFDLRLFGGVLSTGNTGALGKLTGPVQVSDARSIDPVSPVEHGITRVAHTTEKDAAEKDSGTMGSKWTVPYGLYQATITYSAPLGDRAGVTSEDLELLYRVLVNMWDHTAAAGRVQMATRALVVFSHDDQYGKAPRHTLIERVQVVLVDGVMYPRSHRDYTITVDDADLPEGVTVTNLT